MGAVLNVTKAATFTLRRAIIEDADRRQQAVLGAAKTDGFQFDWSAILRDTLDESDLTKAIREAIRDDLDRPEFTDTVETLGVNARLIAAYVQRRHEQLAGIRKPEPATLVFAESAAFTPTAALKRWRKLLGLTDEQVAGLLRNLNAFRSETAAMKGRLAQQTAEKLIELFEEALAEGMARDEFVKRALELLPGYSQSVLETEFQTTMARVYSDSRDEMVMERSSTFPFLQFMALLDSRTTWWICEPMGTSGPNGTGYIAATEDVIWNTWRTPCHFRCRSQKSPISYLEAKRLGILAADGKTKIARSGSNPSRPFGDPPKFAEDPGTGTIRRVEPQIGFGA